MLWHILFYVSFIEKKKLITLRRKTYIFVLNNSSQFVLCSIKKKQRVKVNVVAIENIS